MNFYGEVNVRKNIYETNNFQQIHLIIAIQRHLYFEIEVLKCALLLNILQFLYIC